MKLLFLSAHYPPLARGGGEISTHLLAQELAHRGHDVQVITEGAQREESMLDGVKIVRAPLGLTKKPLFEERANRRMARELAKILYEFNTSPPPIRRAGPTLVHAHDFRSALVLSELIRMQKIPAEMAYVTLRDYASVCGTTNNILRDGSVCHCTIADLRQTQRYREAWIPRRYARLWQYWYNVGYRQRAFGNIPNQAYISAAQRDVIYGQTSFGSLRHTVIHNPVPETYLSAPLQDGKAHTVLYAGTVENYKGVDVLIAAWQEVARRNHEAHLIIVGEGAQLFTYKRMVERAGLTERVEFVGKVPWERMQQIYESAQLIVAPHCWVEPFGRTVAEAMALGKVVLSANTGGPAEMIEHNKSGFLFAHGSAEALAQHLVEALALPVLRRREMGAAARAWAKEHLAPDVIAKQYEEFYTAA
ncbi:MAG: hypothetical protein A2854_02040 [Parcubacteria group bacterium RIFCSPHIGHO2_01_FULL_56_18]|nr:MAG: hypothetical protein A2854_02040 [Parcubacteria group bacterium RIFCSPHIGHO2_01_FULL_56_18]